MTDTRPLVEWPYSCPCISPSCISNTKSASEVRTPLSAKLRIRMNITSARHALFGPVDQGPVLSPACYSLHSHVVCQEGPSLIGFSVNQENAFRVISLCSNA